MMELSLEAYRIIINNVRSRVDLATLCLVSKGFRRVAERALYNTLFMHEAARTKQICKALASQSRVAELVEALTIAIEEDDRRGEEEEVHEEEEGEEEEEEGGEGEGEEEEEEENEEEEEGRNTKDSEIHSETTEQGNQDENMELAAALTLSLDAGQHEEGLDIPIVASSERVRPETQEDIWPAISDALKKMARLRHLSVVIDGTLSSPYSGRLAWILNDCPFRLKSFHSDMRWDEDLVRFLNVQDEIEDLYIGDYDEGQEANVLKEMEEAGKATEQGRYAPSASAGSSIYSDLEPTAPSRSLGAAVNPPGPSTRLRSYVSHSNLTISPSALPHLYTLECTFSEAAIAIVPGRPVSKLKTCFSRTDPEGKREEMQVLFKALGMALAAGRTRSGVRTVNEELTGSSGARGGWHALDIADAEYEEKFAMDLLRAVVNLSLLKSKSSRTSTMLAGGVSTRGTLKYLGTLVLPVGGRERLLFYGHLMQLRRLCCVELEITAWNPSPAIVGSVAFRALGNELRLYCPGVVKIVFVSMNAGVGDDIGERTTVEWVKGEGMARVESEVMNGMGGSEGLWRDV